jgi:hypothetical protein
LAIRHATLSPERAKPPFRSFDNRVRFPVCDFARAQIVNAVERYLADLRIRHPFDLSQALLDIRAQARSFLACHVGTGPVTARLGERN